MKLSYYIKANYPNLFKKYSIQEIITVIRKLNIKDSLIKQFISGISVELEHGSINKKTNVTNNNLLITGKIALAHLNEMPDYYVKLKQMEN